MCGHGDGGEGGGSSAGEKISGDKNSEQILSKKKTAYYKEITLAGTGRICPPLAKVQSAPEVGQPMLILTDHSKNSERLAKV